MLTWACVEGMVWVRGVFRCRPALRDGGGGGGLGPSVGRGEGGSG